MVEVGFSHFLSKRGQDFRWLAWNTLQDISGVG